MPTLPRFPRAAAGAWALLAARRSVAATELGLLAPVLVILLGGVYDATRALLLWRQIDSAAEAVAQAAEKLSVSSATSATSLTATQMQTAMTSIYGEIPGLNGGGGVGIYTGSFSVTLSSVVFWPLCQLSSGCTPETSLAQTPYTLWSSYLTVGGPSLNQTPTVANPLLRACGALTAVARFPNDATQLTKMIAPTKVTGAASMITTPQVVADVRYTFAPIFGFFLGAKTFYASAALPSPTGGTDQEITFNATAPTGNVVSCAVP